MLEPSAPAHPRLEIVEIAGASADERFAHDVRVGLSAPAKAVPSKYFYDELGSALFDAITHVPEYYLTVAETEILREWGWEIVRMLHGPIEFLELGSGSSVKTQLLIDEALRVQPALRYSPIDISSQALRTAATGLVERHAGLEVRAVAGDYFTVLASKALRFERPVLAMLMGSNLGNYAPDEASALVALVGSVLRRGDGLLLGVDLKKDRAVLERAYDDPIGVTAAFDKNLLARINRELDADFDPRTFDHVVHYDEQRGCVESFLRSRYAQRVRIAAIGLEVDFAPGETIHTESSYKFDTGKIEMLADDAGLHVAKMWTDRAQRFAVYLLTP